MAGAPADETSNEPSRNTGSTGSPGSTGSRKPYGIVFLTLFLDMVGFGILIPIQPFYAEQFGASPSVVTMLSASYSLMQLVFSPLWGRLSDRIGRRPVVLTSVLISAFGFTMFGFATSLWMLFAARMIAGFGNANIGTVQAIIADVTSPRERAKGMGIVGAAFGLGFIFGPVLGASLVQFGLGAPAFVSAGLALVNFVVAFTRLPETRVPGAASGAKRKAFDFDALRRAATFPNVAKLFALFFVFTTGFAMMETALGLFIERVWVPEALTGTPEQMAAGHHQASRLTGYLLFSVGVASAIVQGGLVGRLNKALGERALMRGGLVLLAAAFLLLPVVGKVGDFTLMYPVGVLLAVGSGVFSPALSSFLSRSVPGEDQGAALGLGQSFSALGRVVGPMMSGHLLERAVGLPFQIGAALMIGATLLALSLTAIRDGGGAARERGGGPGH